MNLVKLMCLVLGISIADFTFAQAACVIRPNEKPTQLQTLELKSPIAFGIYSQTNKVCSDPSDACYIAKSDLFFLTPETENAPAIFRWVRTENKEFHLKGQAELTKVTRSSVVFYKGKLDGNAIYIFKTPVRKCEDSKSPSHTDPAAYCNYYGVEVFPAGSMYHTIEMGTWNANPCSGGGQPGGGNGVEPP